MGWPVSHANDIRKLAPRIGWCLGSVMIPAIHDPAVDDVSWLAIRHPAVVRLLERELAFPDGDALAAGLELACRVLGGRKPIGDLRLDHNMLNSGMVAVRSGRCDRAMVRSIREQIHELRVVLTAREQDAVATVIAAIIWSVLDASSEALEAMDTLVA
jgi:hypothetical protein